MSEKNPNNTTVLKGLLSGTIYSAKRILVIDQLKYRGKDVVNLFKKRWEGDGNVKLWS